MGRLVTSAAANKILRSLEDEKQYILSMEKSSSTYIETDGVSPIVPQYDYVETQRKLEEIDQKVMRIKHAINVFNCVTVLPGLGITIDQGLVKMAQLNNRKKVLDSMRKRNPKARKEDLYSSSKLVEYECVNYEISDIKQTYDAISQRITDLQMEIDLCNQTMRFEIED